MALEDELRLALVYDSIIELMRVMIAWMEGEKTINVFKS
jgi:hypothetical protein